MSIKVFVDGQEGTTGLQIHERLQARADVQLLTIDPERRKDREARAQLLNAADVAFLCLPDEAARESVALVENAHTCVIDASTAHRIHPEWAYGLPELSPEYRQRVQQLKRIAVGGCHATAFLLLVHPLVEAGLLPADYALSCFSLTGYSGGGKKMIAAYQENPPANYSSPRPYALGLTHKHLPEMRVHGGLEFAPVFNPVVGPFYQGLAVTIPLQLRTLGCGVTPMALHATLHNAYQGAKFVQVHGLEAEENLDAGSLDVQACNGTNRADIFVFGNNEQVALVARLDNLGKGASGAAVQCMNLHLGLPEESGLV